MSLYFDLVISCDLKDDTPEAYINTIRCLTDRNYELSEKPELIHRGHDEIPPQGNVWDYFDDYHFLASDLEKGIVSNFRKLHSLSSPLEGKLIFWYSLQFSGRLIHDDYFYPHHLLFLFWFGSIAMEGFIGYYKHLHSNQATLLYGQNGRLKEVKHTLS